MQSRFEYLMQWYQEFQALLLQLSRLFHHIYLESISLWWDGILQRSQELPSIRDWKLLWTSIYKFWSDFWFLHVINGHDWFQPIQFSYAVTIDQEEYLMRGPLQFDTPWWFGCHVSSRDKDLIEVTCIKFEAVSSTSNGRGLCECLIWLSAFSTFLMGK